MKFLCLDGEKQADIELLWLGLSLDFLMTMGKSSTSEPPRPPDTRGTDVSGKSTEVLGEKRIPA